MRASKVHRRFAADGRSFQAAIVADGLTQAAAYDMEAYLIAKHRRESVSGTLWNVLAGGEGGRGIPMTSTRCTTNCRKAKIAK